MQRAWEEAGNAGHLRIRREPARKVAEGTRRWSTLDANSEERCCAELPAKNGVPGGTCGKSSGTINAVQREWMLGVLDEYLSQNAPRAPLWHMPPTPCFDQRPVVTDYYKRPFVCWAPHLTHGLETRCPVEGCAGKVGFKEWSMRTVEDVDGIFYAAIAVMRCTAQKCKTSRSVCGKVMNSYTHDADLGYPLEIKLGCPFTLWHRTAFSARLTELAFHSVTGASTARGLANTVAQARRSAYLRAAMLWRAHVAAYAKLVRKGGDEQTQSTATPADYDVEFGHFHAHCHGYNMSLGPDVDTILRAGPPPLHAGPLSDSTSGDESDREEVEIATRPSVRKRRRVQCNAAHGDSEAKRHKQIDSRDACGKSGLCDSRPTEEPRRLQGAREGLSETFNFREDCLLRDLISCCFIPPGSVLWDVDVKALDMNKIKTAWDNFVQSARSIPDGDERSAAASHLHFKTKDSIKVAVTKIIENAKRWGNVTRMRVPQTSPAADKQAQPDTVVPPSPPPPPPPQQLPLFPILTVELRKKAVELADSYRTRHNKTQIKWMGAGGVFDEWELIGLAPCYHESLQTDIRNRSRSMSTTRTGQVRADTADTGQVAQETAGTGQVPRADVVDVECDVVPKPATEALEVAKPVKVTEPVEVAKIAEPVEVVEPAKVAEPVGVVEIAEEDDAEVADVTRPAKVVESTAPSGCVHGNMFVDLQRPALGDTGAVKELAKQAIEKSKFSKLENDLLHHVLYCPMSSAYLPRSKGTSSLNWRNVHLNWLSLGSKLLVKNPAWKRTKQLRNRSEQQLRDRRKQWAKDERRKAKRASRP